MEFGLACDWPYLTGAWLDFLAVRAAKSRCDAARSMNIGRAQPLYAMYHSRCEAAMGSALKSGVRGVTAGLAGLHIEPIALAGMEAFRCGWVPFEKHEFASRLRGSEDWARFRRKDLANAEDWFSKWGSLGASSSRATAENMSNHYLEFRNVSKSFDDHAVLRGVSFFIDHGETAVIMGRSGVGKSVSLKLLLGFLLPDEGQIIVAGEEVTDYTEAQFAAIRRRVTMVFQSGALFDSLTVAENVAFPLTAIEHPMEDDKIQARVRELLEMLEVAQFGDRLPADLSTGTKRAVAIARALAENPDGILYDEPTTMVDPLMAAHVSDLIVKLKQKFHKTSIVVTHDTHLAKKLADRVIFLQDGRVSFFGTWTELEKSSDPFLRNFLLLDELIPALDESV